MSPTHPDYLLRVRPPAEADSATTRRIRRALKALGRQYGLRVVEIHAIEGERSPLAPNTPAPPMELPDESHD